jgi:hypothetical protein
LPAENLQPWIAPDWPQAQRETALRAAGTS